MSTRQYIGARYVPKFADPIAWDNTRAYEALTIVDYLGTSYTSKKAVPVGVAITNSEYWVATGIYNAQVEQYRQEVVTLEQELKNKNRPYDMDFVIFIGDSFANDADHNWVLPLVSKLGLSSDEYVKLARGSVGFARDVSGNTFVTMLQDYTSGLTTAEKNRVSHIIVCGGGNDAAADTALDTNRTAVLNAIATFCSYANSNYPNAEIYIGGLSCNQNYADVSRVADANAVYAEGAIKNGAHFLDGCQWILKNKLLVSSDGVHPTNDGYTVLGEGIWECLMTGFCHVSSGMRQSGKFAVGTDPVGRFFYNFDNGVFEAVVKDALVLNFDPNVTITSGTPFTFSSNVSCYWTSGCNYMSPGCEAHIMLAITGGTYKNIEGRVYLEGTALKILPLIEEGGTSGTPWEVENVRAIAISPCTLHGSGCFC